MGNRKNTASFKAWLSSVFAAPRGRRRNPSPTFAEYLADRTLPSANPITDSVMPASTWAYESMGAAGSDSVSNADSNAVGNELALVESEAVTVGTEAVNAEMSDSEFPVATADSSTAAGDSGDGGDGNQNGSFAAFTQNGNQNQQGGLSVSATSNWDCDGNQFVLLSVSGLSSGESLMAEFDGAMAGYVQLVSLDGEYMVMLNQPTFGWAGVQLVNSSGVVVADATFTLN